MYNKKFIVKPATYKAMGEAMKVKPEEIRQARQILYDLGFISKELYDEEI